MTSRMGTRPRTDRLPAKQQHARLVDFEQKFCQNPDDPADSWTTLKSLAKSYVRTCSVRRSLLERFPVIGMCRAYRWKRDFVNDVISGVMSGVMMIPLGLAYASLSTLPHVIGLYMSFFASVCYFVFGTSRHLSWGCVAIVSLMMANLLDMYDHSDQATSFINSLNQSKAAPGDLSQNGNDILPGDRTPNPNVQYDYGEFGDAILSILKNGSDENNILTVISDRRIEVASSVAVVTGVIFVVESMIGLDCFTALISNSLIAGFTVGVAFNIATSQIRKVLGLSIERFSGNFWIFRTWAAVISRIEETNVAVLVVCLICLVVLFIVKRFVNERYKHRLKFPVPIELFVVVAAILASKYCRLNHNYDVRVLGAVQMGLPKPKFPDISLVLNLDYILYGLVIAFVAHVQSLAVAKTIALEDSRSVKGGQEMFAAGMCSIVCGFFSGFTPSAYVPISIAQRDSGGVTQIASLFSAGIVLLFIMVLGPYFHDLPDCVMSAIILVNIIPLFLKIRNVPEEWRRSKYDCFVWVFACLATIILEIGNALFISVGFSIFLVLLRSIIKPVVEVVPIPTRQNGAMQIRPVDEYVSAKTLLTVKLMKIKTALYFFNSEVFIDTVFSKTNLDYSFHLRTFENKIRGKESLMSSDIEESTPLITSANRQASSLIHWKTLILDISEVSFIDGMGVDALDHVIRAFKSVGINVMLVSIPDNLFAILRSTGFWKRHEDRLYIDVQSALDCISAIPVNDDGYDTPVPSKGTPPQIGQWV